MTIQETGIVMDILTVAYPGFYTGKNAQDPGKTLKLWAEMFRDDDVKIVAAAVKALIATKTDTFPPSIGAVKEKMRQIFQPEEMTELEAWSYVRKAIANSAYRSQEEFEKLPPVVQSVVYTHEQLKEWARMDEKTINSVVSSNFQRSYKAKAKQVREFNALPSDIQRISLELSKKIALPDEKPQKPVELPEKVRTLDDIKRDAEKTKKALERNSGRMKAAREYAPLSESEFEGKRAEMIRRLRGQNYE